MNDGKPLKYMRQLDALRAVAVVMVIVSHWAPNKVSFLFNGDLGVQLFFAISGFLITGILLDAREKAEERGIPLRAVVKNFYARRFLRIFPVFYATLLVTYVAGYPAVRESIGWHVSYLSNALFAVRGEWLGEVSHFWSLAVEEQFYLVWPWMILFVPRRLQLRLVLAAVFLAPVFRFAASGLGLNTIAVSVLPFASLDTLGLGSLLAFLSRTKDGMRSRWVSRMQIAAVAGLAVYLLCNVTDTFSGSLLSSSVAHSALAIALVGAVSLSARGIGGPVGWAMELAPVVYLGRISYGVYLFHNFVPLASSGLFGALGYSPMAVLGPYGLFLFNFMVLMGVSILSWHLFEKPINNLKRFVPYVSEAREGPASAPIILVKGNPTP